MPNITVRPATESDWAFLCTVQELCMREYAERTWGTWIPEPLANFRPEIHQIIRCNGDEIGCIAVIDEPDALMLEKLYILPSHQRLGIGTVLLGRLIERARADEKPIRLRVLRVNPARRLYERSGFKIDRSTNERHFMSYAVPSREAKSCEADTIRLIPMLEGAVDRQALFDLYKLSLHQYVEQTFGWDEGFQRERFNRSYPNSECTSITVGSVTAGYFALRNGVDAAHLSLLLLHPEFRNRGIGRDVMHTLMSRAAKSSQSLTLSSFLCNQPAMNFYQKLGFSVVTQDEHFVTYRSPAPG